MTAEAIFDISTTKNQEMLFFVGRQRFQSCLYLLYVVNFVFLSVTIILVTLQLLGLLQIELGRQVKPLKVPVQQRYCNLCNLGAVEDEDHFIGLPCLSKCSREV